jgi:hypothetical protein
MTHQFHLVFTGGLRCTITFDPAKHWDKVANCPNPVKKWYPKPQPERSDEVFPQYVAQMHAVHKAISKIVNQAYITVVQDSSAAHPAWAVWKYFPDGKMECLDQGDGVFQPR